MLSDRYQPSQPTTSAGYSPSSINRGTVQGLSIPGSQALQGGPGVLGARFPNYGTSAFSVPSSYAVPSSFDMPQNQLNLGGQGGASPPNMNQYLNSSNLSTLLRALVGNTDS